MKFEYCCKCSGKTGRAGAGDDSLYTENDGPFCKDCFPEEKQQPPQRKPLTDEEIGKAWSVADGEHNASASVKRRITRAIEATIKENT